MRRFIGTAEQVFCKAEENMAKGDEELAYVMYMRFFNIITAIKKARDFRTNEVGYSILKCINLMA